MTHARVQSMLIIAACACLAACSDATTSAKADTTAATNTIAGCTSSLTLSAGQVSAGLSGPSLCVAAGTSVAEYALIPFNSAPAASAAFSVTASGTSAPSALPTIIANSGARFDVLGDGVSTSASAFTPLRSFEQKLRARERSELTSRISGARTWQRQKSTSGTLFDVIPSTVSVGQILRLNSNSDVGCTSPVYRGGRVVSISDKAIVVADTGNPAGGYSDAEYASFGVAFDTLIDPLDRAAFGAPTDIDNNGRVILFFTKTVNDLTPANSSSYIGGFFDARDLFPVVGTTDFDACPASNMGEMFYVMVPDPTRGGAFTKTNVQSEVYGTLAHEYQHLINASRRMYVNTAATDFEETWLDEGLAHTAEELLFYRVSGLSPRQNIAPAAIRASTAIINAFNDYQSDNFGRYQEYLNSPSAFSPYSAVDSLEMRGASWSFLRYAADRAGTTDGTIWYQLVNSTTTGLSNLQNVFGTSVMTEMRDWATSVLADDITGVDDAYQQPSWNFRAMYGALNSSSVFPIASVTLSAGTHAVSLTRGGTAFLRFTVAAGGTASVQWSTTPSTVQFTLVRTK